MKYEETCACGAVMKMVSTEPVEIARTKGQWKMDHEGHGLEHLVAQRRRLDAEMKEMQTRVEMAEDRKYPATVAAYDFVIQDTSTTPTKVLYQATLHPGNGFHWEHPASGWVISLEPTTMKLPDIETKAEE